MKKTNLKNIYVRDAKPVIKLGKAADLIRHPESSSWCLDIWSSAPTANNPYPSSRLYHRMLLELQASRIPERGGLLTTPVLESERARHGAKGKIPGTKRIQTRLVH